MRPANVAFATFVSDGPTTKVIWVAKPHGCKNCENGMRSISPANDLHMLLPMQAMS